MNRLQDEASLYLRQHADNPVDWWPWGEAALAEATERDVPILLSVGYSSCHWCHVMAHESFEDAAVAEVMNANFVPVKVDREERPDVDDLYMQATVAMTGHGGWPMTVFLTPGGEPFYAGTYFPPVARGGLPSFRDLLEGIAEAWGERRGELVAQGASLARGLASASASGGEEIPADAIDSALVGMARAFDPDQGGFGRSPKFPPSAALEYLLRRGWAEPGNGHARAMAELTLVRMAEGGIHDHVGGGFHRYSVDGIWLVPHFEKMLYDNAQLAAVYAMAADILGNPGLGTTAGRTLDYLLREMRTPEGGFAAAQDADSPGGEGAYFTWTPAQLEEVLTPEEVTAVRARFGVTEEGNFEGATILSVRAPMSDVAVAVGGDPAALLGSALRTLYSARAARPAPGRDDKMIASWNGLAIAAFAEAGRRLSRPDYLAAAAEAADAVLGEMIVDGRLMRTHSGGRPRHLGQLDDHADLCHGLLTLYEATFEPRWVVAAKDLVARMIELFADDAGAGFWAAGSDGPQLIARMRSLDDQPTPGGNSQAARVLTRLASLTGDWEMRSRAEDALELAAEHIARAPQAMGVALTALSTLRAEPREVAIVGDPEDPRTAELIATARAEAGPWATIAARAPGDEAAAEAVPLLAGRTPEGGAPTAWVCRRFTCRAPVTSPADLAAALADDGG